MRLAVRRLVEAGLVCLRGKGALRRIHSLRREGWRRIVLLREHRCGGSTTMLHGDDTFAACRASVRIMLHGHDTFAACRATVLIVAGGLPMLRRKSDQFTEVLRDLVERSLDFGDRRSLALAGFLGVARGDRLDRSRGLSLFRFHGETREGRRLNPRALPVVARGAWQAGMNEVRGGSDVAFFHTVFGSGIVGVGTGRTPFRAMLVGGGFGASLGLDGSLLHRGCLQQVVFAFPGEVEHSSNVIDETGVAPLKLCNDGEWESSGVEATYLDAR